MVVGKRHDVHPQQLIHLYVCRICPKREGLILRRRPSRRKRKLIVEHKDIRTAHPFQQIRRECVVDITAPRPVVKHHGILIVEQDIPRKRKSDVSAVRTVYEMDILSLLNRFIQKPLVLGSDRILHRGLCLLRGDGLTVSLPGSRIVRRPRTFVPERAVLLSESCKIDNDRRLRFPFGHHGSVAKHHKAPRRQHDHQRYDKHPQVPVLLFRSSCYSPFSRSFTSHLPTCSCIEISKKVSFYCKRDLPISCF